MDSIMLKKIHLECLLEASSLKDIHAILQMVKDYCDHGKAVSECPAHLKPVWIMFKHYLDEANKGAL